MGSKGKKSKANIISDAPSGTMELKKKKKKKSQRLRSESQIHDESRKSDLRDYEQVANEQNSGDDCCSCICRCLCMGPYSRTGTADDGSSAVFKAWAFAAGTQCYAYRGYYTSGPKRGQRCCVKRLRVGARVDRPPKEFQRDVEISKLAIEYATIFNSEPRDKRKINFTLPQLCRIDSTSFMNPSQRTGEWVTIEDWLPGKFEKFVTNAGHGAEKGTLTSFCHFTYDASDGKYLIVDMQGVMNSTFYGLTDACIHTTTAEQYGELDHGKRGIMNFFATHECTGLCRGLKAPKIPSETLRQIRHQIEIEKEESSGFGHSHR